jgi:amino acid transporter/nucleotide-binding universal stress UspA family protein
MKNKPTIEVQDTYLSRDLSEFDITMIGVGAMIGAGIFVLTGIAAGTAGPGLMLAFALNGIVTIFTAMVYAELGSAIPESGGGYLWIKEAFGGGQGFLAGWMSWFSHAVAGALYALGFGSYFALLLKDLGVPLHLLGVSHGLIEKGLAVLVVLIFLYINFRGTSETGTAGNIITLGKLAIIGLFIAFGLWAMMHRSEPAAPFRPFFPRGLGSVFVAMGFTFIAFEGYEIIVQAGEEVRNPRRSIPRAVFWSLIIVVPIYVLVGLSSLGAIESSGPTWQFLGEFKELGLVKAAAQFMPFGSFILLFGGLLSTLSALNATTFSSTRVSFAMGRDKALPGAFGKIHSKTRTPYVALAGSGVIILAMVVAIPIEEVATAADVMFLLLFTQVNVAVLKIRREFGDRLKYGYLLPFYPWVPIIGVVLQAFLAVYLYRFSPRAWFLAIGWIVVGTGVFFAYARQRLQKAEEPRIARARTAQRAPGRQEKEILVAVSEESPGEAELRVAGALCRARKTSMLAVHVVQVPRQTSLAAGAGVTHGSGDLVAKLERFAKAQQITIHSLVAVGHSISHVLGGFASREKVPIILLGWRGHVYERRIRGSIADAVLRESAAHVLLVRDRGLPENIEKIVLAASPGIRSEFTLDTAISLARGFGAVLRLVSFDTGATDKEALQQWLAEIKDICGQQGIEGDNLETEIVATDRVVESLVEEADRGDLFIMGAARDWVDKDHLLGKIPDSVANRSKTTVVVAKQEEARLLSLLRRLKNLVRRPA